MRLWKKAKDKSSRVQTLRQKTLRPSKREVKIYTTLGLLRVKPLNYRSLKKCEDFVASESEKVDPETLVRRILPGIATRENGEEVTDAEVSLLDSSEIERLASAVVEMADDVEDFRDKSAIELLVEKVMYHLDKLAAIKKDFEKTFGPILKTLSNIQPKKFSGFARHVQPNMKMGEKFQKKNLAKDLVLNSPEFQAVCLLSEIDEAVDDLLNDFNKNAEKSENHAKRSTWLTVFSIIVAVLTVYLSYCQLKLAEQEVVSGVAESAESTLDGLPPSSPASEVQDHSRQDSAVQTEQARSAE